MQSGDTLWKIAETQYGHGKGAKYRQIFEANKPLLKDPDKIYPGQRLRIPGLAPEHAASASTEWKPPQEIAKAQEKKSDEVIWKSPNDLTSPGDTPAPARENRLLFSRSLLAR